jgi:bla regulator protein BlaR1
MFLSYLLASVGMSSITFSLIFVVQKAFAKQLSAKWKYHLWFLFLVSLTLPLLPNEWINVTHKFSFDLSHYINSHSSFDHTNNQQHITGDTDWLQNFPIQTTRFDVPLLNKWLTSIWIIGMLLKKLKANLSQPTNQKFVQLFERCKQDLQITKKLTLAESPLAKSPFTFGLFHTYVIIPVHIEKILTLKEMKYVFLHELHHFKAKDIFTNYFILFFQTIYWFHPLVWIAFRQMKLDREIACDHSVLLQLDKKYYRDYGHTIIHFADHFSKESNFVHPLKQQLKKRIEAIASFTTVSKRLQHKSKIIVFCVAMLVVMQIPFFLRMTYSSNNQHYHFSDKQTQYIDLSNYFTGYEGSFVLYHLQTDQYRIYNKQKSTLRVSPNSTYKIYSALFALDSNVITSNNSVIKWDQQHHPYPTWNTDQNLQTAMRHSVSWYFQTLDKHVKQKRIQHYLEKINYGNKNLSAGLSQYWAESSLKISPIEQVQRLKAFYVNEHQFNPQHIETVKEAILLEEQENRRLYGKTGTGERNGANVNGWFIGYVELKDDTYFFATNIKNEHNAVGTKAVEITKSILRDNGIY